MGDLGNGRDRANIGNRVLDSVPREVEEQIIRAGRRVELSRGDSIYQPDQLIEYVTFPLTGAGSVFSVYSDGTAIAVGTVGNEGMMGLPVYFGTGRTSLAALAHLPMVMLQVPAAAFLEQLRKSEDMRAVLDRHAQALFTQLAVSGACHAIHVARQRLARWLLMNHDRNANGIGLSQEAIGEMLGLRRATVGEAAAALHREGGIDYRYGNITVTDRSVLERATCECYWTIRNEYARLLGV